MLPARIASAVYWCLQPLRGRRELRRRLTLLEETQWLSPNELKEFSFRKLEALLKHAYETVPYYHETFDQRGFSPYCLTGFDQLERLPVLTRDALKQNFERLKSSKIGWLHAHESCSSGLTGKPARFMQDASYDTWCRAHQLRTYGWCGSWRVGERFALVWGSPVYWDNQTIVRRLESAVTNRLELNCNNVGLANLRAILNRLRSFRPALISGYSTSLFLLAELARTEGVRLDGLRAVQPNAEPTYPHMAKTMGEAFGVPVYDKYGSTETNIIAHQSPAQSDVMCIQVENAHVEFVSESGEPCQVGTEGRIIATTLNNFSMPLIRYQTSDLATPLEGSCPSGRGFPLMSPVIGRLADLIRTADGERVHPQVFSNLFSNFPNVQWFQVIQNSIGKLDITLLVPDGNGIDFEPMFTKMINLRTRGNFEVRYHYIQEMPQTTTGKHKLCVCNLRGT